MSDFVPLTRCLCCDAEKLVPLLDLQKQPLANSYHDNSAVLPAYPLMLNLCTNCFHAQQAVAVDPDLMFKNYAYVSGTTKTLLDYFDWFARMVEERFGGSFGKEKAVLDIACNDGSQLKAFQKYGWGIWGVDPAKNLLERSRSTGATVVCDYFNKKSAGALGRTFDIVVAQNVFAHVAEPLDFLRACALVMHKGSKLLIQTSQAEMFERGEFDTIYHEHISFFSARSLTTLAHRAGFSVEDIFIAPIHGGSYVFVLGYGNEEKSQVRLASEQASGRYELSIYRQFAKRAGAIVENLKKTLQAYSKKGYALVGFGAAAKGNTLLNFGGITLDYIIDENPLKQGLYTPGMNIKIEPPEHLAREERPAVIVPLAWNFFDEIYRKSKKLRPGSKDVFITFFPAVTERY